MAEKRALCHTCPRRDSRPEKLRIREFKRLHETEWDSSKCFLDEGIICLGPATRGGCEARCINANMPCRGCFGPVDGVKDHGVRSLSAIASLLELPDEENATEEDILAALGPIADPAGLFYMYSLPSSLLRRSR